MRVIALESQNVKRIKAVRIVPTGNVVQIAGRNGSGKTSVLDSIFYALAGKDALPARPVRRGESVATIKLDLGDVKVTRKIAPDRRTEVIVEAENGARFPSPQRMLDALLGALSFDPLTFANAEAKAQLETLRSLVKLEVDVDQLDRLNEADYAVRTDWNRRAKSFTERVATVAEGVDESDVTPVDISLLTEAMAKAAEHNGEIERIRNSRTEQTQRRIDLARTIHELTEQIDALQKRREIAEQKLTATLTEIEQWGTLPEPVDVRDLRRQIDDAQKDNARREFQSRQRLALAGAREQLREAETKSRELTERIDARKKLKTDAIAGAQMPVEGLSFGEGMVMFNGFPLDQASAAEKLRVSFAVAMAMNPKLKVVLIRDGSLLDEDSMALVEQMAEAHDYQVFVEIVRKDSPVGVVIEDGEVIAVDGVPVEAVAAAGD